MCRKIISDDSRVFEAWGKVLLKMRMWLCTKCMRIHDWKKSCSYHNGDVVVAPLYDNSAKFLIHGVDKPTAGCVTDVVAGDGIEGEKATGDDEFIFYP